MRRWPALLLLLCLFAISRSTEPAAAAEGEVIISGGDLSHPVRLTAIDSDAFARRLSVPPKLDDTPDVTGAGYTITTSYWDDVLRNGRSDRDPVEAAATYYEDGGYVRTRQGNEDVWIVLDLRQRAIIDRYLRLTRAGLLRERPGILEVLVAASRGESIGIDIGGNHLSPPEAQELWAGLSISPRPTFRDQRQPPTGEGAWLVFSLEEGRSVQARYQAASRTLTDFLGTESYRVIETVAFTIESTTRGGGSALSIEQQDSRGSGIWWVVMIGGGVVCLGAAAWLTLRGRERMGAKQGIDQ